ncbi:hypothetical protein EU527_04215 [Candidatus Thorarchaeota archaeon]|nr:MAG: hypothetical protein EU527_04215 [Candidatus Thorarchaeota archaeon]
MPKMKWFMKQYWRIGQTRALLSLAMGMLSLGRVYVDSVPVLSDWGFWGAVLIGGILFFVFLGIGWVYDIKARMWSPDMQAAAERDVYKYLPNIKTYTIDYPLIYALLNTMKTTLASMGLSTEKIDDTALYMSKYYGRNPERKDILQAQNDADQFISKYPFQTDSNRNKKIPFTSKAKLVFSTNVLRLNWVQDLTGLIQDSLVFAGVYIVFIFPDVSIDGKVPLFFLGIGFIIFSVPLLFAQTSLGWYYDKKLRVWSASNIVSVERSPYTYVAFPRQYSMDFPFFLVFLETLRVIYTKIGMDTAKIDWFLEYIGKYGDFRASKESDFLEAQKMRREFGTLFNSSKETENTK